MMKTLFLDSCRTKSINYRPALPTDTYVLRLDGEDVAIEGYAGFALKELSPSKAKVETRVLGKADKDLVESGEVISDEDGNEVSEFNSDNGGVVKDPKKVIAALQKLIDRAK